VGKQAKIYVAGHKGLVGSALLKVLGQQGYANFVRKEFSELNLNGQAAVNANYHPENSHVLLALIRCFHEAKAEGKPFVNAWGTGEPRREFYYSEDMAEACVFLMNNYEGSEIVNIGCGQDMTIRELYRLVAEIIGYQGEIRWDRSRPGGTLQKMLDVTHLHRLGFNKHTPLSEGIRLSYQDFLDKSDIRK